MKRINKEEKDLLDVAWKYAPLRQVLLFGFWDIFYPKKRDTTLQAIKDGMSWRFAYERGKKSKIISTELYTINENNKRSTMTKFEGILKDLEQGKVSADHAEAVILDLFSNIKSVCPDCGKTDLKIGGKCKGCGFDWQTVL